MVKALVYNFAHCFEKEFNTCLFEDSLEDKARAMYKASVYSLAHCFEYSLEYTSACEQP